MVNDMAIIKTSGLYDSESNWSWSYNSGMALNNFLLGPCGDDGALSIADDAFEAIGDVLDSLPNMGFILANLEPQDDGSYAGSDADYDLVVFGKNLGAFQEGGKGSAKISSLVAKQIEGDAELTFKGNLVVNSKGVSSGSITSISYDDGDGTVVDLGGKLFIKNSEVSSAVFNTASIDDGDSNVTLTGKFSVGEDGSPDGAVSSLTFGAYGDTQLSITDIEGLLLSDVMSINEEDGLDFEDLLSGNDKITVVYASDDRKPSIGILGEEVRHFATIEGFAGDDTLNGGIGDDSLLGGTGKDQMAGGKGDDYYEVDNAKDSVVESSGKDSGYDTVALSVSEDFHVYKMAANVEEVYVDDFDYFNYDYLETADTTITGNALDNYIGGGRGSDTLSGGAGNDVIIGDDSGYYYEYGGNDVLNGGAGNDVLNGGYGINTLTGGAGADLFVHDVYSDGTDSITDFKSGTDKLVLDFDGDLRAFVDGLDRAGPVAPSNSDYWFDGSFEQLKANDLHSVQNFDADAAYTKSGIYFDSVDGEVWYVEYDTDNGDEGYNGDAYLMATLEGVNLLRAADIILIGGHEYFPSDDA